MMHYLSSLIASALTITPILALPAESPHHLNKRGPTDTYGDYTGSTSSFPDGSGKYVTSGDQYTYRPSGDYCWTDVFANSKSFAAVDWKKVGDIDCATTQSCTSGTLSAQQQCSEWSIANTISRGIDLEIFSAGLDTTFSYGQTSCTTATSTNACTWTDDKCHSTWVSTVNEIAHGYIRRRCNIVGGAHEKTVWSKDLDTTMPEGTNRWGCAAACSDAAYPSPVPPPPTS